MHIIINFVEYDDIMIFSDYFKGMAFIEDLPKKDIREGKIVITYAYN